MAATDSDKQLLSIIRSFATEKSQGERRVAGLKKRIQELQFELEKANADLQDAKSFKEVTEQELKGYEVELSLNEASIQALETRISSIQEEVSKIGSDIEAIKNEEAALRDEFIDKMFEFNKRIRKFQEMAAHRFQEEKRSEPSLKSVDHVEYKEAGLDVPTALKDLEAKLADVISKTHKEEQEYRELQNVHGKAKQELVGAERQVLLLESVVKEMKELQELTRQLNQKRDVLPLVMICSGGVCVPDVIWIMQETWERFFRRTKGSNKVSAGPTVSGLQMQRIIMTASAYINLLKPFYSS